LWSDSSGYSFLEISESGEYWVQGWDERGCLQKDVINILDGQYITFTNIPDYPSCFGASDGGFDLIFDPEQSITSFQWSNNLGTNEDVTGIDAGNYSVTITNTDGCVRTFNFILEQPDILNVFIDNGAPQPTAIANGGTPPYSFVWTPGNYEGEILPEVAEGVYTVTVTDANGCTDQMSISTVGLQETEREWIAYPNPTSNILNIQCDGCFNLQLINAIGQVIYHSATTTPIDCSSFAPGLYQLRMTTTQEQKQMSIRID
jgi:ribosomal protein S27E